MASDSKRESTNSFSLVGLAFISVAFLSLSMVMTSLRPSNIIYTFESGQTCLRVGSMCISEAVHQVLLPAGFLGFLLYGFSGWALYKGDLSRLIFWTSILGSAVLLAFFPVGTLVGLLGIFKLYVHREEFK